MVRNITSKKLKHAQRVFSGVSKHTQSTELKADANTGISNGEPNETVPLSLKYYTSGLSNTTGPGVFHQSLKTIKDDLQKLEDDVEKLRNIKSNLIEEAKDVARLRRKAISVDDSEDSNILPSSVPCGGCGAHLQCSDKNGPGFIHQKKFKQKSVQELEQTLCKRCHLMIGENRNAKDGAILEVNVNKSIYTNIIKQIKKDIALVLMVVDVTDISNSVMPDYLNQIGQRRPLFIIGNKVDLIPRDDKAYLRKIEQRLLNECVMNNLNPRDNNIRHVFLVSAKTGYGIEELINKLFSTWENKGNVYLVGTANSGKSTLFNRFLDSDYCKHTCRDIAQRATMSRWPGTTLNVLKFPILRTNPHRSALRTQRLIENREKDEMEKEHRYAKLKAVGKSHNAVLFGTVGKTNFNTEEEIYNEEKKFVTSGQDFSSYTLAEDGSFDTSQGRTALDLMTARRIIPDSMYPRSVWTYDTPGLINHNQLITCLTPEELKVLLTFEMLRPRVFVMAPGDVMFASGLARIDYLQGAANTFFTVHIPHRLPVHIIRSEGADDFYSQHLGTSLLGLPLGDRERINRLPSLVGREFHIKTFEALKASADLQLSSLGWVSFAGHQKSVHIRAYTPGGRGMHLRSPALLPNILAFKGKRMPNSRQYAMKKLSI